MKLPIGTIEINGKIRKIYDDKKPSKCSLKRKEK